MSASSGCATKNTRKLAAALAVALVGWSLAQGQGLAQNRSAHGSASSRDASGDGLMRGFETPPEAAKLRCYWWWLNGNTDEATITHDLTEMKAKGFGGALLVDANGANQGGNANVPAGPMFGSPAWTKLYLHALKVASELGLEISLNATSGWNLGGPMVKPEDASKLLTWSRTDVAAGAGAQDVTLAQPPVKNGFYRQIAVLAYPLKHGKALAGEDERKPIRDLARKSAARELGFSMPKTAGLLTDFPAVQGEEDAKVSEVRDVSAETGADGVLHWKAPAGSGAGEWEILRIGYTDSDARVSTSSGAWQGLAIDYMDHVALDHYWDAVMTPLLEAARPYTGKTLKYVVTDSWELGGTNWTVRFREEFQRRRGYDPVAYLPIVAGRILNDRGTSDLFLNDLRRTVGDLIVAEHYDAFAAHAAKYGLGTHSESGGPHGAPLDALETFRSSTFPQTEYWAMSKEHRSTDSDRFFVKEGASAAHIYGKPLVADEGMTSVGPQWSESLGMNLKPSFDQAITEGMTRLVWHQFTSSPANTGVPGQEYFAGTHLNPKVTWWKQSESFLAYLNRAQYMMQQGQPVADLLYYYGEEVPNFVRLKADDPGHVLPGYDYDVTNQDALLHRMLVNGGLRTPEGITYRALALPTTRVISAAALAKAIEYLRGGGILIGERPLRSLGVVSAAEKERFDATVHSVWDACDGSAGKHVAVGQGQIFCTDNSREALRAIGVAPDFEVPSSQTALVDYIHRRTADTDIYFIRNTQPKMLQTMVTLRVDGKQPLLFDASTGDAEETLLFAATADHRTELPLTLPAYGSVFVVFHGPAAKKHVVALTLDGRAIYNAGGQTSSNSGAAEAALPIGLKLTPEGLDTPAQGGYRVTYADGSKADLAAKPVEAVSVAGPWTLTFPPDWGAPAMVRLKELGSWSASADAGVRYFSGTATYRTTVHLPASALAANRSLWLNLGEVHEVASVRVNGKPAEVLWKQPWSVRVDRMLHPGDNAIEIEVTNLWPNRIIGDAQPGAGRHYTKTNIRKYTADSPLLPSGMMGPVTLTPMYHLALRR